MKLNSSFIIIFSFVPFYFWSFLGGHKQDFYGINSDYIFIALAAFGAVLIWFGRLPRGVLVVLVAIFLIGIVQLISFIKGQEVYGLYALLVGFVYLFISSSYAVFFSRGLTHLVRLTVFLCFVSYLVVIFSWVFMGFSSWGRITIPIYDWSSQVFAYYPYGYEGSSDVNVLAYFLYSGIIVCYFLWMPSREWYKVIFIAAGLLAGILTVSRSAALSFAIMTFLFFLLCALRYFFRLSISVKLINRLVVFLVIFVPASMLLITTENQLRAQVEERVTSGSVASNEDRINRLTSSLNHISESDIYDLAFGGGVGYSRNHSDPHNFYISTFIDLGFVGLMAFFVGPLFLVGWIVFFSTADPRVKNFTLCISLFFLLVSLFYWQLRFYYYWCFWIFVIYLNFSGLAKKSNLVREA